MGDPPDPDFPMNFPLDLTIEQPMVQRLGITLVILVGALLLIRLAQRIVPRYLEEPERRYKAAKFISRAGTFLAVAAVLLLWAPDPAQFVTLLTVIGAGLAIALREVLLSVAGWLLLIVRPPFRPGDRIEVNGVRGDVLDVRLLHTALMEIGNWVAADQSTGRIVHVPNSWLYNHQVYNYNRGFSYVWNELSFTIAFSSDWRAAREIVLARAEETSQIVEQQVRHEIRRMAHEYLVHYSILTPFVYVTVAESGIRLTLRYLCEVRKRRGTQHALTMSILDAFHEHGGITFASSTPSGPPPTPPRADFAPPLNDPPSP